MTVQKARKINMSNSSLVSYTGLSPNHSGQRTHSIDRITPHCVVGQLSAETICACFPAPRPREHVNDLNFKLLYKSPLAHPSKKMHTPFSQIVEL